jgi:predicted nucleic acid-binding protein
MIPRSNHIPSEMVEPVSLAGTVCKDPDDDKFLEAAIAADADYIVSGDAALLRLKFSQMWPRGGFRSRVRSDPTKILSSPFKSGRRSFGIAPG